MQMKPKNLDNIIAMVALYRPGPMGFIPEYIDRMHGKEKVEYRHELLKPIMEETFGIAVYQEQIMSTAISLAGYSAAESDALRKAISKKKEDEIKVHEKKFIEGAVAKGIERKTAVLIFDDWRNFAQYGFNKSHAADYGVVAVQTAYLKAHYPLEYMTALLCGSMNDSDKVAYYIADCLAMDIPVLPPDVNHSQWNFSIEEQENKKCCIRFGMGAIKNVGQNSVDLIIEARGKKPFEDLNDFVHRVDLRRVGKRTLECLIRVGALDAFGDRRAIYSVVDRLIAISESHFRAKEGGQLTFFGAAEGLKEEIRLPDFEPMDKKEKMKWEKELLGIFLTDHPLSAYLKTIKKSVTHSSAQLREVMQKEEVTIAGRLINIRSTVTKKGDPMGFATLEDMQGAVGLVIFPRVWNQAHPILVEEQIVLVRGKVDGEGMDAKVLVDEIQKLETDSELEESDESTAVDLSEEEMEFFSQTGDGEKINSVARESRGDFSPDVLLQSSPEGKNELEEASEKLQNEYLSENSANKIAEDGSSISPLSVVQMGKNLTIVITASGKKDQDIRLLKQVYGMLHASPGEDRFTLLCRENGKEVELDFPNDAIQITDELLERVNHLVGKENVQIRK